jgi:pSer/pThr/pTyr-binding forkhead associated (FHA) protein
MDAKVCDQCGEPLTVTQVSAPADPGSVAPLKPASDRLPGPTREFQVPLAYLTIIEGDGGRRVPPFQLTKDAQGIGRSQDMPIRLLDETVSRQHAVIWWEDGGFYIQDEPKSKAGTMVNNVKVTRESLKDGDVIQLGRTKLVFHTYPGSAADASSSAA